MALIEEMDRSGNWLFRWRSFLPLLLLFGAVPVVLMAQVSWTPMSKGFDRTWWWPLICWTSRWSVRSSAPVRGLHAPRYVGPQHQGRPGRRVVEYPRDVQHLSAPFVPGQPADVARHRPVHRPHLVRRGVPPSLCPYYERLTLAEEQFLQGKFGQPTSTGRLPCRRSGPPSAAGRSRKWTFRCATC